MNNSGKLDDIDLFIVTEKNRIWLSRLLLLLILSIFFLRRQKNSSDKQSAGQICINLLLDNDSLIQQKKNIYLAHEVLQMQVLWQRSNTYKKYLEENSWVFKYLPNWIATTRIKKRELRIKDKKQNSSSLRGDVSLCGNLDFLEMFAGFIQKRYMGKPSGKERISDSALYFHPMDYNQITLNKYSSLLKKVFI